MINFLREISQKEKILSKTNSNSLLEHLQIFFGIKNPGIFYSGNFFWNLKESLRTQITGWHRSLIWCPSQLHKEYTYRDYTVSCYARWRHTDPWTGHFILQKNTNNSLARLMEKELIESTSDKIWSEEILSQFEFTQDEHIREIEIAMEELYKSYFIDKIKKLRIEK